MNIEELNQLISSGETETMEFKESFNDSALEAIGSFANANGGTVLIGVSDLCEIVGVQVGRKTIEDIANRIQDATDPRVQPSISAINVDDKKSVVVIQVTKSTGIPVSIRGRFYKRVGKTKQRMSHEEIIHTMTASTGLSWDAEVEPGATLDQLNNELIERFIQAINKFGRRSVPEKTSIEELFTKLGLLKENNLTRAALLLFHDTPQNYFPSSFIKVGRFRSPTIIVDDREIHGSLIQQLDEVMSWFRERLETKFTITGEPEREVTWEYPLDAVREAVVNLLCHRDFCDGTHSQIRLYDERLEFWNPGFLPAPLTPDLLYLEHESIPRNRQIANIFYAMGFIERWAVEH